MLVLFLYVFLHCRTNCCHQMQNPWLVLFVVVHCSVTQSCLTLDPVDCSMPGFPVLHHLPELAQTHVHWVSDAIWPSHPRSCPSPPALNLSGTGESAVKSEETETIPWQLRLPDQAVLVTVRLVCIFFQPWSLWRLLFLYLIPNPII